MKKIVYIYSLASIFILGCASIEPGNDPLVVRTEQTLSIARDTFNLLVTLEYNNYELVKAKLPEVERIVQKFTSDADKNGTADALDWLTSLNNVKVAYKQNSSNKQALLIALSVVDAALVEAQKYISVVDSTLSKNEN